MSAEFRITTRPLPRDLVEPDRGDVCWLGDQRPPDPLASGRWGAFRERISTRVTSIEYGDGQLEVTVPVGAALEDCDLALGIVRRVAAFAGEGVETDSGKLTVDELNAVYDADWKREQIESAARTVIHLLRERGGPIAMPGPTRSVYIGERVASELETGDPDAMADRLIAVARRVLWPDPRYESATQLQASSPDGEEFSLAMLLPERACVLPDADRLVVDDPSGAFMIPRYALEHLPVEVTYLDDRNQLVEPVSASDWPDFCRAARTYQIASLTHADAHARALSSVGRW
jgi:hypothetical protein